MPTAGSGCIGESEVKYRLECGNSKELLKTLESDSIDSIVTDPPYELGFMGKKWDSSGIAYDVELWTECLRVLKPGGHLLAFSGSRTYHRMAVAIEDAGFDIRDQIMWVYGSGFPKSHDVSKAIDKMAGAEREVVGKTRKGAQTESTGRYGAWGDGITPTAPATEAAKEWNGWGTALKPAHEPICVARKPLIGTVAENVLQYGTGGINVDGCRVKTNINEINERKNKHGNNGSSIFHSAKNLQKGWEALQGRWPANIIHDGSKEVLAGFPEVKSGVIKQHHNDIRENKEYNKEKTYSGSAARFFYCAKASKKDRDEGLEGFEEKKLRVGSNQAIAEAKRGNEYKEDKGKLQIGGRLPIRNHHPTVKPTNLMQYLCRLVTPPNGVILDPFLGSGSTGKAAMYEGFNFVGFDLNSEYIDIARARIEFALNNKEQSLFDHE